MKVQYTVWVRSGQAMCARHRCLNYTVVFVRWFNWDLFCTFEQVWYELEPWWSDRVTMDSKQTLSSSLKEQQLMELI
jgi:hypothetical protein